MEPKLFEYIRSSNAVVVERSGSGWPALSAMLSELGMPSASLARSYSEAVGMIRARKPRIVFVDDSVGTQAALELLGEHSQAVPNRLEATFIVITGERRSVLATTADVDLLLLRPLEPASLREKFTACVASKSEPSPYLKMIEAARRFIAVGKFEATLKAAEKAKGLEAKPTLAYYFEGLAHRMAGDLDAAAVSMESGLKLDPGHYRCMAELFEICFEQKRYAEAYETGMALFERYPIPPRWIPDLIRLCILNNRFDEMLRFATAVSETAAKDEAMSRYVSAGLFICGKHLLNLGKKDEALAVFGKAEAASLGKPNVLREIIAALYSGGYTADAERLLKRAPASVSQSSEVRMAILEVLNSRGLENKVLLLSEELIRDGVRTPRLFEIALTQAKGLNKPETVVRGLLSTAVAALPQEGARFEHIAKTGKAA